MRRFARWYGAGPLHLIALIGCFAVAGYAAIRLLRHNPDGIIIWFVGAAVAHDLVLLPMYSLLDRVAAAGRSREPRPRVPWINHVRVPASMSGLLLLVWFPLILRLPPRFQAITTFSTAPYFGRWLVITASFFTASGLVWTARAAHARWAARATPGADV